MPVCDGDLFSEGETAVTEGVVRGGAFTELLDGVIFQDLVFPCSILMGLYFTSNYIEIFRRFRRLRTIISWAEIETTFNAQHQLSLARD